MLDPVASLRVAAVDVQVGDWVYTVPALAADRWLEVILADRYEAIFPGLLDGEDRHDVYRLWLAGDITGDDLGACARDALSAVGGRDWWEVERLVRSAAAETSWPIIMGDLTRRGVRLDLISLSAFCDAVWAHVLTNATEEQRHQLEFELRRPPSEIDLDELYDEEGASADFEADLAEQQAG
jgi:hypothetical protein